MRLILIFITALLLTGCYPGATTQQMIKDTEHYQPPIQAPIDKGLIYIVRPSSLYGLFKYNIYLDGKQDNAWIGYNRGYQYVYFQVAPGTHTLASQAENWSQITIDLKAGETLYILQDVSWGFLFGRNEIKKLNPIEGKYYIKHSNLGTMLNPAPASQLNN